MYQPPLYSRKALYVIRENIRSLLVARKEDQAALAQHCGHDRSWLNKFLNSGRGIQLKDLDLIAGFFGIEPYQLFQPGISSLSACPCKASGEPYTMRFPPWAYVPVGNAEVRNQ